MIWRSNASYCQTPTCRMAASDPQLGASVASCPQHIEGCQSRTTTATLLRAVSLGTAMSSKSLNPVIFSRSLRAASKPKPPDNAGPRRTGKSYQQGGALAVQGIRVRPEREGQLVGLVGSDVVTA